LFFILSTTIIHEQEIEIFRLGAYFRVKQQMKASSDLYQLYRHSQKRWLNI